MKETIQPAVILRTVWLVLGSNNFWYGVCDNEEEVKNILHQIKHSYGNFGDDESGEMYHPNRPKYVKVVKVENYSSDLGEEIPPF